MGWHLPVFSVSSPDQTQPGLPSGGYRATIAAVFQNGPTDARPVRCSLTSQLIRCTRVKPVLRGCTDRYHRQGHHYPGNRWGLGVPIQNAPPSGATRTVGKGRDKLPTHRATERRSCFLPMPRRAGVSAGRTPMTDISQLPQRDDFGYPLRPDARRDFRNVSVRTSKRILLGGIFILIGAIGTLLRLGRAGRPKTALTPQSFHPRRILVLRV